MSDLLNFNGPDKPALASKTKVGLLGFLISSLFGIWGVEVDPKILQTIQAISLVFSGWGARDALAKR